MEFNHNQVEVETPKIKKKLPRCKQKRNLDRLLEYNKNRK